MRTIEIDGKPLTVELDWDALKSVESYSKEVKALVQANPGVKSGLVIKAGGVTVVGLVPPGQKVTAPSAAAWLAEANHQENERHRKNDESETNWIVVEKLADDQYWLCVIKDEVPLPGSDVVDDWEGTAMRIGDLVAIGGFIVYSNDEVVQTYVSEASPAQDKNFSALIQGVKYRNRVRVISGVSPAVLIAIGAVVVLGAAWWGYSAYSEGEATRAAQAAAQAKKQQQAAVAAAAAANYDKLRHEAVATALAEAQEELHRSLSTPSPTDVMSAWADLIDKVPLDNDGWALDKINCSLTPDLVPVCTVHLIRSDWGINRTLAQDHPDVQFAGDSASYDLKGTQLTARDNDRDALPKVRAFGLKELSDLQEVKAGGVKHTVNASSEILKAIKLPPPPAPAGVPTPPGVKPADAPTMPPIQMGVATGELDVEGDNLWQIRDIGPVLESSALVIQGMDVSVSPDAHATWKLKTQYFIKTLDAPVVPDLPPLSSGPAAPGTPGTITPVPTAAVGVPTPGAAPATPGAPGGAPAPGAASNGLPTSAGAPPALGPSTVQASPAGAPPVQQQPNGIPAFGPLGPKGDGVVPPPIQGGPVAPPSALPQH